MQRLSYFTSTKVQILTSEETTILDASVYAAALQLRDVLHARVPERRYHFTGFTSTKVLALLVQLRDVLHARVSKRLRY
jgi:hypothetical protein